MSATSAPPRGAVKLMIPRAMAIEQLLKLIEEATAIRNTKIRSAGALDQAREMRVQWTSRALEALHRMFDDKAVGDECMGWVGKILPEYAELDLFVQQFEAQMDHHLRNLKTVVKMMERKAAAAAPNAEPSVNVQIEPAPVQDAAPQPQAEEQVEFGEAERGILIANEEVAASAARVREFIEALGVSLVCVDEKQAAEILESNRATTFVLLFSNAEADLGFEMGYRLGRLGVKCVCALHEGAHVAGAWQDGIAHLTLDAGDGWQLHLARYLKRAGMPIDLNRLAA